MNRRWLILVLVSMGAAAAHAGTVVDMEWRSLPDGKARPHTVIYAQHGQFRMDSLDSSGHVQDFVVVRDGNIWQVNVTKRTFYLFDKAALANQQTAMQGRWQSMLQTLPPEQRAAMEARMQGMMQHAQQANVSMTDTGRTDRVGSWNCEVWRLQLNGKHMSDACIAPRGELTGGDELVDSTHKAANIAADVLGSLPVARASQMRMELYGKSDGFPLRVRHLDGDTPDNEEIVSSIKTRPLPADTFAIPKGFTQTTMAADTGE
ncbi:MAG TPA: DUF4412 domain-containing protein [Steroidobacteraceae bacterium]|nr:DUF4412 domain-containing protein [Steroidobacteraceae bacterium]